MQLTNTEIIMKLRKMFTPEEIKIFCKIEAEKYKLQENSEIIEEPKYEATYWANIYNELKDKNHDHSTY